MTFYKKNFIGILLCLLISLPAWYLGKVFPIIGGPVLGILFGIVIAMFPRKENFSHGITFTSKKILKYAIILLGFGMNLFEVFKVGSQSLLIIISTISTALIVSYLVSKLMNIPKNISILIGVGSSICGGSAIAATAPVIDADDQDIAKSISIIFLFNIIAAFLFPLLGNLLGLSDTGFGMFAGTAINDTSSVVAAGQTWSNAHGNDLALNYATIVKLTRTLAIIPITVFLGIHRSYKESSSSTNLKLYKIFPWFILFFLLASIISTVFEIPLTIITSLKSIGKFFITMAMVAIGLNTNMIKLIKSGATPIFLGLCCWISISFVSLIMQHILNIW